MSDALTRITSISRGSALAEYGTACQRIFPDAVADDTFGSMACWLAPGTSTAPDEHNQRELLIVLSGDGAITVDETRHSLTAGDVLMIEREYPHVIHAGSAELHWISVYWPRIEPV